jgi:hypothetical protein
VSYSSYSEEGAADLSEIVVSLPAMRHHSPADNSLERFCMKDNKVPYEIYKEGTVQIARYSSPFSYKQNGASLTSQMKFG